MSPNAPHHAVGESDDAGQIDFEKYGCWLYLRCRPTKFVPNPKTGHPPDAIPCISQRIIQWSLTSYGPPKPSLPSWCASRCSLTWAWRTSSFLCSPMLSRSGLGLRRRTCRGGILFCWPRLVELRCLDRVRYIFSPICRAFLL